MLLACALALGAAACGGSEQHASGAAAASTAGQASVTSAATAATAVAPTPTIRATTTTTTSTKPAVAPPPSGPCGTLPVSPRRYAHVIWIWFENKTPPEVLGPTAHAPYLAALAHGCGLATNDHGVSHPTLPNLLAATSGSTQGIHGDGSPAIHALPDVPSLFGLAGSWRSYVEGMPAPCTLLDRPPLYAVRDNPAVYYGAIAGAACTDDVPLGPPSSGALARDLRGGTLPRFALISPDRCNDMHDCPVATGDRWLSRFVPRILASRGYRAGRTAIFITWDENPRYREPNRVALIAIAPGIPAGTTTGLSFDHYALLRTTEELLGLRPLLGRAAHAPSLRAPLHL